jgi:hypothetical protein
MDEGKKSIPKQITIQISEIWAKKVEDPISLGLESELKEGAATLVL